VTFYQIAGTAKESKLVIWDELPNFFFWVVMIAAQVVSATSSDITPVITHIGKTSIQKIPF